MSEILAKSPLERLYHVFLSFSRELIWKICPLVLAEILEVFVNTLTSDGKYPLQCCENFQLLIQMQLSEKRKTFSKFLFHFWILHEILNILNDKMIIIANVFPKLQTVKIFLRPLSKKLRFRTRFDSQRVKGSQMFAKSPWERSYHVLHHSWGA